MPTREKRAELEAEVIRSRRIYRELQIPLDDFTDDEVIAVLYTLTKQAQSMSLTYTQFVLSNLSEIKKVGVRKFVATLQWIQGQKQAEESKYKTGPLPELRESDVTP
jgi:hypothetical protein